MHCRDSILLTAFAVTLLLLSGVLPAEAQGKGLLALALAPGDEAPKLIGWNFDQELQTIEYEGRLTLVNFWATWCQPCRQEMPSLQGLHDEFGEQGLQIVGFNQEPEATLDQVTEHLESLGVTYVNLKPDRRFGWGGISTVPTSFMVGPDGRIMRKYVGAKPEQIAGLERDVEDALNGRPLKSMVLPKPPPQPAD